MKTLWRLLSAIMLIFAPADADAQMPRGKRQLCEGVVAYDADGMLQLMDTKKNASLWCDAYIGEEKNSRLAKQVLAHCPVGSRCLVDGYFVGHGVFYWTRIVSARLSR
jgi:hypothetical protein